MKKYSIIIPHHDIPMLLRRCIKSIPLREDTEVIVVDDESCSCYLEQINALQKEFPYVRFLFNSKNIGAGGCRNIGLEHAEGGKIIFADADDYFNYCFNDILDEYSEDQHDVVYFNASSVDSQTYTNVDRMRELNDMIKGYESDADKAIYDLKYVNGGPCCKIIKKSLINDNNIEFEDYICHEDTKFSYMIGYYSQSVAVDQRAMYCVTCRPNSLSSVLDEKRILAKVKVFLEKEAFLKSHSLSTDDCKLHYYGLIEAYKSGNRELYGKVIGLFEHFGYKRQDIETYVKNFEMGEKKQARRQRFVGIVRKYLRFCVNR